MHADATLLQAMAVENFGADFRECSTTQQRELVHRARRMCQIRNDEAPAAAEIREMLEEAA